ncbi:MAG TPA: GNAT family N-acetyltransferase [Caproicibacter sp.]|nr:GNAT family N-acetyltransferase [Caproicibacter sp.]
MTSYKIRRININELIKLTDLCDYTDKSEMIEENTYNLINGNIDIFVLSYDNKFIGELHIKYKSDDILFAVPNRRAYLYAFRIHKSYQGKGLGTLLLNTVICELESKGYTELTVGVEDNNERAKYIYNKFGFTKIIARRKECYQRAEYEYNLLLKCDK